MKKSVLPLLFLTSLLINESKSIGDNQSHKNIAALIEEQKSLVSKQNSTIKDWAPIFKAFNSDKTINELQQKIEDEKNKCPELKDLNKELTELEQKADTLLKNKYPNEFKKIKDLSKDSLEAYKENKKIADQDPEFRTLQKEITNKESFKYEFTNDKIKNLISQINQRKKEIIYDLHPELKQIDQELRTLDEKVDTAYEIPAVKDLIEKIKTLNQKRTSELEKIKPQLQEALEEFQKSKEQQQIRSETRKLTQEILTTDPKLQPALNRLKKQVEEIKKAVKEKYSEEYAKIENFDPVNLETQALTEAFEAVSLNLSEKDTSIKELRDKLIVTAQNINSLLTKNKKFSEFMQNNVNNTMKKIQEITYKINPEIEKLDLEIKELSDKLQSLLDEELGKINKKEAPTK